MSVRGSSVRQLSWPDSGQSRQDRRDVEPSLHLRSLSYTSPSCEDSHTPKPLPLSWSREDTVDVVCFHGGVALMDIGDLFGYLASLLVFATFYMKSWARSA